MSRKRRRYYGALEEHMMDDGLGDFDEMDDIEMGVSYGQESFPESEDQAPWDDEDEDL